MPAKRPLEGVVTNEHRPPRRKPAAVGPGPVRLADPIDRQPEAAGTRRDRLDGERPIVNIVSVKG